jgi:hypothetical protein
MDVNPTLYLRVASAAPAASLCAGHVQQLGGESPLPNLMEVKASETQGLSLRGEVRRKRRANVRVDGQEPDTRRQCRTSGQRTAKSISIKARSVDSATVHRRRLNLPQEICAVSPR